MVVVTVFSLLRKAEPTPTSAFLQFLRDFRFKLPPRFLPTSLTPHHPRIKSPMSRSSAALQQWLKFRQSLSSTSPTILNLRAHNLLTPPSRLALTTTRNGTTSPRRPFHSTQYRSAKGKSARPAPALRRKMRDSEAGLEPAWQGKDGVGLINNKGFYMNSLSVDTPELIAKFKEWSEYLYADASSHGLLENISYRTFEDVAIKVFDVIDGPPNPHRIRSISTGEIFDFKPIKWRCSGRR